MRSKNTKSCTFCNIEFVVKWPHNPNLYCSTDCRAKAVGKMHEGKNNPNWKSKVTKTCEWCKQPFEAEPWNADKRIWCSQDCCNESRRNTTGKDHPYYKPKVRIACEVCGTVRYVKPSLVSRFRACSKRCAGSLANHRSSSLETATKAALDIMGEVYEAQARFEWYSVDFYIPSRRLVIECDGSYWHSLPKQVRLDKSKDTYLRNRGYTIVRLEEADIRQNVYMVVQEAIQSTPPQSDREPEKTR